MRACQPSRDGYVERDGVKVFYEVFGAGEPTVVLLPTWSIMHSRHWKLQVPYLARHCRVVAFDGRGNGRSDRPTQPEAYRATEFAADTLAVMDATGTDRATLVGLSCGALWGTIVAADHPERQVYEFDEEYDTDEGWAKYNSHFWSRSYREFLGCFFAQGFSEPHSTKPIEDAVGWGLETDPETLANASRARSRSTASSASGPPAPASAARRW